MTKEQLKAKSNAILDKLEEDGFDLDVRSIEDAHNNGFINGYNKANEYARAIIKDLLFRHDEYARQRAIDFLKEKE